MTLVLGGTEFRDENAVLRKTRSILASGRVSPDDERLLRDLLDKHPEAARKIRAGVQEFYVAKNAHGGRCFWIRRLDGGTTDFSVLRCLSRKQPFHDLMDAARRAAMPLLVEFRERELARLTEEGRPGSNGWDVRYEPPLTLRQIVEGFLAECGITADEVPLRGNQDHFQGREFASPELRKAFLDYHERHAKLTVSIRRRQAGQPRPDSRGPSGGIGTSGESPRPLRRLTTRARGDRSFPDPHSPQVVPLPPRRRVARSVRPGIERASDPLDIVRETGETRMHAKHLYVAPELSVAPDGAGQFIVISPLTGGCARVNEAGVRMLQQLEETGAVPDIQALEELRSAGLVTTRRRVPPAPRPARVPYWSTSVTLMPTARCTMRCIYCYSNGGDRPADLPLEAMLAAVDFVADCASARGGRHPRIDIHFHGGGEPLHPSSFPKVKATVNHARELATARQLALRVGVATNGVLSNEIRAWLIETVDRVQISLDGPPDVQDRQRPLAGGQPSSTCVVETIRSLAAARKSFGVRATVSAAGVARLGELVRYFRTLPGIKRRIHLEALYECGRCAKSNGDAHLAAPGYHAFLQALVQEQRTLSGRGLVFSSLTHRGLGSRRGFCGVSGTSFVVTPDGDVSACHEVCERTHPLAKQLYFGRWDAVTRRFEFDGDRIRLLAAGVASSLDQCGSCFLKYTCAGFCAVRMASVTGRLFRPAEPICEANRDAYLALIRAELDSRIRPRKEVIRNGHSAEAGHPVWRDASQGCGRAREHQAGCEGPI